VLLGVYLLQTDISSIRSQPNMRYTEVSGQVFARKSDYINSIVRACARKLFWVSGHFGKSYLQSDSTLTYLTFII